jgi:predicted nucleotidyltransferase
MYVMKKPLVISFGSQTKGRATSRSDFDFAVLDNFPLSISKRAKICQRLSKKCGINEDKIDLIDLNMASPLLKYEVAKTGKLVEGEQFDFIRFKVGAWKMYLDTAKFRRLREKSMKQYVQGLHS